MEKLLFPRDVCQALGIEKSTLYSWTSRGLIPYMKVNGLLRFRENVVEQWLKLKERGFNISDIEKVLRQADRQKENG